MDEDTVDQGPPNMEPLEMEPLEYEEHDRLLTVFRAEAAELLEELIEAVEALPERRDAQLEADLRTCMRHAHNVKGASSIVGIEAIERLAHALEDGLSAILGTGEPPDQDRVQPLVDCIGLMQRLAEDEAGAEEVEEALAALALVPLALGEAPSQSSMAAATDQARPEARTAEQDQAAAGNGASDVHRTTPPPAPADRPASGAGSTGSGTIRIETERLDRLIGFAGELLVTEARLEARSRRMEDLHEALRAHVGQLDNGLRHEGWTGMVEMLGGLVQSDRAERLAFGRTVDELSAAMRGLRMLPVSSAAPGWRRVVRETSRQLGKQVRLVLELGTIEVDRGVLERIREPILHLLRNAIDHGIEPADERRRAGKPPTGTVRIICRRSGSEIHLELSDDGRGIDLERLLQVAVETGVVGADEAGRLSEREILDLLFRAGLSGARSVSQVSGRGVGLDVVHRSLTALGGRIQVEPHGGLGGACFRLDLPASLLSSRGLLVRAGGSMLALPLETIERTMRVARDTLARVDGRMAIVHANSDPIPVHDLRDLLGLSGSSRDDQLLVLVMAWGAARLGIVVDQILEEEEYVVKRLPWNLIDIPGISGAVILADGSLALAVDPSHLLARARGTRGNVSPATPRPSRRLPRVLVADDSLTARTLERNVLLAAGYDVELAVDGRDAWQRLLGRSFDLVVSDVEMPGMDGFELTRRIRAETRLRTIPVVLVTRLASTEDRARGAAAGADAHVVKGRLEQEKLLEVVARLLGTGDGITDGAGDGAGDDRQSPHRR